MFDILGIDCLNVVREFLFTYDGTKLIFICGFDYEGNEVPFEGTPLCMGKLTHCLENALIYICKHLVNYFSDQCFCIDANGSYPLLSNYFQVIVEEKHMVDDCFAVVRRCFLLFIIYIWKIVCCRL